jgi:hypothetical protein
MALTAKADELSRYVETKTRAILTCGRCGDELEVQGRLTLKLIELASEKGWTVQDFRVTGRGPCCPTCKVFQPGAADLVDPHVLSDTLVAAGGEKAQKAKVRYRLLSADGKEFVEMPETVAGRRYLEGLRKGRPDLFRGRRIGGILQTKADEVRIGELHEMEDRL